MKIFNGQVPLFWDAELLTLGYRIPVTWDIRRSCHAAVCGKTGSGKTVAVKLMIAKTAKIMPLEVTLCDFKADDFLFLDGADGYYKFSDCLAGLNSFYDGFQARQQGADASRSVKLFVFDEWASFINTLDKKDAEAAKMKLATLLMLGRSFLCYVLLSQQRFDAAYFSSARDNFGLIVGLGNLSKESAAMFDFPRDEMKPVNSIGGGYMMTNGELKAIQVPYVRDMKKLDAAIKQIFK